MSPEWRFDLHLFPSESQVQPQAFDLNLSCRTAQFPTREAIRDLLPHDLLAPKKPRWVIHIVGCDKSFGGLLRKILKEPSLRLAVGCHIAMIIQVILGQVREDRRI